MRPHSTSIRGLVASVISVIALVFVFEQRPESRMLIPAMLAPALLLGFGLTAYMRKNWIRYGLGRWQSEEQKLCSRPYETVSRLLAPASIILGMAVLPRLRTAIPSWGVVLFLLTTIFWFVGLAIVAFATERRFMREHRT